MYGWCERDEPKNGSKAVTLLLRLSTLALALASAVTMATVDATCTVTNGTTNGTTAAAVTYKDYRAFVFLVGSNVAAAVLQAAAIYLQLSGGSGGGDDDDEKSSVPGVLLVVVDVLAQALLYSATAAAFSTEIGVGCVVFGKQVGLSKLLSLGASVSVGLAAVVKDVPLPFSVWPSSSD
ncbi:CASP-like protein 1U2 [Brachypodium distachyon]|uniref:CASP-like protein n=1 Tax=Brachypodium distachyon TaxID=15368 RepID=A0A0Q3EMG7_BRADI|nr:CASP-like protein 1U2 [Brachypodium distachyon]KQJ87500.1 hypothetical protein BRADI_4g11523v3 [Brachypodium distachyon]|eukprot:XP_003577288.1 CASP-like protein 1U2 [Brachypodium distachyon]